MNETNPIPPEIPPQIPPEIPPQLPRSFREASPRPLGDDPAERVPIPHAFAAIDAILRHPRRLMFQLRQPDASRLVTSMVLASIVCSAIYGAVAGTSTGGSQLGIASVKVAIGLMISATICLPSLYIFTCLSGSQARLMEICGLLSGLLLLMTVLLIGFAPVAWIFSQSTDSLVWMGALHLTFWLIATYFGLRFLHAGFSQTSARSHAGFNTWVVIFVLVALQMTTALRPILGRSDTFLPGDKKFFAVYWGQCLKETAESPRSSLR